MLHAVQLFRGTVELDRGVVVTPLEGVQCQHERVAAASAQAKVGRRRDFVGAS